MEIITLPGNYQDYNVLPMSYIQLNITTAGAFCILTNTATFNPPLPTGLLSPGKYPDPVHYPNGSQATGGGTCNYTFSTQKLSCGPGPTEIIGKVIVVGSGLVDEDQKHDHK